MANVAETLLALLDHADGAELEVLLEAENLLAILVHFGRSKDDVRAALRAGKKPGELLLEVFLAGHKKDELFAVLGESGARQLAVARANTKKADAPIPDPRGRSASAIAPSTTTKRHELGRRPALVLDGKGKLGVGLIFLGALAPPMFSYMDLKAALWFRTNLVMVAIVIAICGALGGVLIAMGKEKLWIGAIGGALVAVGGAVSTVWYLGWGPGTGRATVMRIEIVLASVIGMIPGAVAVRVLRAVTKGQDT